MDQKERQVIDDLFGKFREVEGRTAQRDPQAEDYIRQQVSRLPAAPYYMAQAILVQEQALATLQSRVQQLEQQPAQQQPAGGGGFLSSIFGGGQSAPARPQRPAYQQGHGQGVAPQYQNIPPQYMQPPGGGMMGGGSPWGGRGGMGGMGGMGGGGGGFLAGAMQTAVGVAGGMMVANALTSAFDSATVSESEMAGMADQGGADAGADAGADGGFGEVAGTDAGLEEAGGFQEAAYEEPAADFGGGDFGGDESI